MAHPELKATPGPWHVHSNGDVLAGRSFVLYMAPRPDPEQRVANARLCAAAPDLYAALQDLCDLVNDFAGELVSSQAYEAAQLALAGARGEPA